MNTQPTPNSTNVRVQLPQRKQIEMQMFSLDQMLAKDHRARTVWSYVQTLDLEMLYANFKAVEGASGRPPIGPEVLLGLWLLATIESISSARALARRCETDIPFLWMCGTISVNHHTLSDFRSNNREFFEKILTDSVTVMLKAGVVTLDTIAQDGMRVRANAGASSFRRQPTLELLHKKAKDHVRRMQQESDDEAKRRPSGRPASEKSEFAKRLNKSSSCTTPKRSGERAMAPRLAAVPPTPTPAP